MKRLLILTLVFLLLACVPTPKTDSVVNKNEHSIKEPLSASAAAPYRYEAPTHWTEMIEMRRLSIVIDADVVTPDTDRYPLQTIKRHSFTGEDVWNLLNACFSGPFLLRENMYSMEEIETDIRMELRGDVIDSDEDTGEVTWAPPTEDTETLVELRARLALCPAEDTFMPFDPNALTYRNEPYVIRSGDGTLLYLNFRKNAVEISTLRNGQIQDAHTVWNGGFYGEPWHRTLDHITVTNASAEDTVNAALTSAGLSEQFGIGLCEKGRLAHAIVDAPYYETLSEGYILYVSRNGGGYMPVPKGGGRFEEDSKSALFEPPSEDSYTKSWQQDWIEIYVSESGIGHIGWYDPNELVAVANENVELLPFAEIQAHIRDDLRYSYAWTDEKNVGMAELHVKRIVLSCAIARIPNNPDEAALVPAWVVIYSDARREAVNAHDRLMLINAIDGSYLHVR